MGRLMMVPKYGWSNKLPGRIRTRRNQHAFSRNTNRERFGREAGLFRSWFLFNPGGPDLLRVLTIADYRAGYW